MPDPSPPRHILLIQLKRIGDVILLHPVLTAIRTKYPRSRITVAIDENAEGIQACLDADAVMVFRKGVGALGFFSSVASAGIDVCLDFCGNDRSAFVTWLSRARRRVTYQRFASKPFRSAAYTEFIDSSVRNRHTVDHYMDLASAVGDLSSAPSRPLHVPSQGAAELASVLQLHRTQQPVCVIHAGSARAEKFWLPERWARVVDHIEHHLGKRCILTGSGNATESAHLAAIKAACQSTPLDVSGKLSLTGTAALIRDAACVCAVDSAPVHLADQLGTPVLALFGPTHPFHWRPRGEHARVLTAAGSKSFSPSDKKLPMESLSAGRVIAELDRWIPSFQP